MHANCPLCDQNYYTVLYEGIRNSPGIKIVSCIHCGHRYTVSEKQPDILNLYNDEVYKVIENRKSIFDHLLNWEYGRIIKRIQKIRKGSPSLLDFGCGKGKFASLAKNKGWQVKCVETAPERAEYARTIYGLEVNSSFYKTGSIFNQRFNVLVLFHVLEHLPEPKKLLASLVHHNLSSSAALIIEVPNHKSLQSRIAGNKWLHLDLPRHRQHFYPASLQNLVEDLHFQTKRTRFFSFHLGVLGMADALLKLFGYKRHIIDDLKNRKSRLLVIAIIGILPFAFLMETVAAATGYGGVIRKYIIVSS